MHLTSLPDHLASIGVTLRTETEADTRFILRLYESTRWDELASTGWAEELKHAFLQQQCALQYRHYHTCYPGASFAIIEVHGQPAGRLYLHSAGQEIRIIDVSLTPEFRNLGIGGGLIEAVQADAAGAGCKVSIHVESSNPARRLYLRLGFRFVTEPSEREIYHLMEWNAAQEKTA